MARASANKTTYKTLKALTGTVLAFDGKTEKSERTGDLFQTSLNLYHHLVGEGKVFILTQKKHDFL